MHVCSVFPAPLTQVSLGHADTRVADGQVASLLVGRDANVEVLLRIEYAWVGEGGVAYLVQSVGGVGDELSQLKVESKREGVSYSDGRTLSSTLLTKISLLE